MARMKQLALDIEESREADEDGVVYSFPNRPIVPVNPAFFDDSDLLEDRLSD